MKNVIKAFGLIVLAAIIGLSMTACSDGGGGGGSNITSLNGTWIDDDGDVLKLNNGNYELSVLLPLEDDDVLTTIEKGTYTAKDGKITVTPKQFAVLLKFGDLNLYTTAGALAALHKLDVENDLDKEDFDAVKELLDEFFGPLSGTYSVSSNTLTFKWEDEDGGGFLLLIGDDTYTKKL
ncbi:MAG: hypothetical protein LBC76_07295 [Treponema sp.]|jgi:hypothetical protein|nr:hypothetical protein [Treponema sp.]